MCWLTVDWVDYRCFLYFVFLGGARRLELPPCNTLPERTYSLRCQHCGTSYLQIDTGAKCAGFCVVYSSAMAHSLHDHSSPFSLSATHPSGSASKAQHGGSHYVWPLLVEVVTAHKLWHVCSQHSTNAYGALARANPRSLPVCGGD